MNNKNHRLIVKMCLIALFSALCYIGVMIKVDIPSPVGKPMIHFGNFFVLLSSVLFGPIVGGASGAIGMGLYDVINGYGIWTLKTVVLKLGIGFVSGFVLLYLVKKNIKHINRLLYIASGVMITIGLTFLILAIVNHGVVNINHKDIAISWPLYTFSLLIGLMLLLASFFSTKLEQRTKYVMFAGTCAIIFNIFGELFFKIIKTMIAGNDFVSSFYLSVASIPSTIINGTISLTVLVFVYPLLYKVVKAKKID